MTNLARVRIAINVIKVFVIPVIIYRAVLQVTRVFGDIFMITVVV